MFDKNFISVIYLSLLFSSYIAFVSLANNSVVYLLDFHILVCFHFMSLVISYGINFPHIFFNFSLSYIY